jgi:Bacterial PH domain
VEKPQTFRSPTAVVIWVLWLLFAIGNWIDLAVEGRDHLSLVAAAVLLLATGVAYVTAQRPRVIADDTGVTVRNPLRDHRIGWASVAKVDLADLLRVHCAWGGPPGPPPEDREHCKIISAWAIHYSRRRQLAADVKARRTARRASLAVPMGFGRPYEPVSAREPAAAAKTEAEKIVRLLNDRVTAARAEAVWAASAVGPASDTPEPQPAASDTPEPQPATEAQAPGTTALAATSETEPPTSNWSPRALAALAIPALILLIVCLI